MNVNGRELCHWNKCMPLDNRAMGKRSEMKFLPMDLHERNFDFQVDDAMAV